ncbi:LytR family transcriptional regulator [Bacillus alveayuensis]|jgi:LCP family protein required for cell wall assembly|uniref:Polyisoprenyl-teichoic acid--peptidoglycan teichoic acid transferase TagU n=1 Tax=Aeribacillus alveayuensis TaxID=279215 RepID=A0ABT9VLQ5_9BACI|nr:LytR family transcriptional regulator [Bacillus alveayuensis]MDQ0161890.1 LCP family protein required for cell wall assembly [Bacillus alveayuensis]
MRTERQKKKRKKILWITLSVLAFLIIGTGSYAYYIWQKAASTIANIQEDIGRDKSEKRQEKVNFSKKDPISILLMGVDERKGDRGRSDSLIFMTVNPNKKSMEMVSIPRDTRTEIVGKGIQDKINHAYAFGGTEMAIKTVEHFLDVPVDYFVKVNMESFKDIVDAVGGVTVENNYAFSYEGYTFKEGKIHLNGDEALAFTRMRKQDPRGDFGRQERQRQVIQAVIEKGASISSITKFGEMFKVVEDNVKTNLTFDEMWDIQENYKDARQTLIQHQIKGSGTKIDGIYYLIVPEEERLALSQELKEHLELTPNTASNE